MFRVCSRSRIPLLFSIAVLLVSSPESASAADITWTNTAGGNWSVAANWNSGAGPVPGAGDVAHITTDGTYTVTLDVDASLAGLDLGGASGTQTLRSSNRTLVLDGPSSVGAHGVLSMGFGTLGGSGSVSNQGALSFQDVTVLPSIDNQREMSSSGVLTLRGALTTAVGSTISVYGNGFCCTGHLVVDNGFTNNGTITLSSFNAGANARVLVNNGVLVNAAGARIVLDPGVGGERELETSLENHGTIQMDQGPVRFHKAGGTLVNASDGTIAVNANATLTIPAITNSGTITVAAGRTLDIFESGLTLNNTNLGGPGNVLLRSVIATFNVPQNTAATRFTQISSTTIHGPGSLTHAAAHSLFMKDVTVNTAFVNQGVVSGEALVYFKGPLTTNVGTTISMAGNAFCCQAHLVVEDGFTNLGTILLSSFGGGIKSRMLVNNGTLVNAAGAQIVLDAGSGGERVLEVALDNYGMVRVDQGPMTFNKPNQLNRAGGTIAVNGGDVYVTNGGTFTNCGLVTVAASHSFNYTGGTLINGSTGVLAGAGTYNIGNSPFTNGGTLDPNGTLIVNGTATFAANVACPGGSGPSVNVDVCGPVVGSGYDRLTITGTAFLSGALNVTVPTGCCLAVGDPFRVLTAGARVGTFSSIAVSGQGHPVFDAQYDATGLTLVVLSNTFTLNANAGAHGGINPSGAVPVSCGGSQTFTITPESCYHIADVLVDGVSVGAVANYTFASLSGDHTISASFAADQDVLSASSGDHGSIDPNGVQTVDCGTTHTFTVTPDACHHIADVLVDGVSVGAVATYTFHDVQADHTISASFAADSYDITASSGSGGSIDPGGTVVVPCGSNRTFTITPNAGFTIADVLVDGSSVGAVATYSFTEVVAPHTIAASFRSVVGNGPPVVSITGPPSGAVFAVGTPVTFTGSFVDEAGDTHTARWTFDGASQAGSVNEVARTVSAVRTFTTPGVFFVTLSVTDDHGAAGGANTVGGFEAMVVVYDPSGGFVTGGGWFNSPAGAYAANPSLTGKANFGFESKYKKGATTPSGETEFQFKVANLNFHSTAYEWLVVAGARAQYKGSGTINGVGDYAFMLSAIDGNLLGGNPPDKFRMKIWNKGTGASIYDNQLGAADSTGASTALGGGSIVVHKGTGAGAAVLSPAEPSEPVEGVSGFALYSGLPNPSRDGTMISFDLPSEADAHLVIYDAAGRVIATLADGVTTAGRHSVAWDGRDRSGALVTPGLYLVRITAQPTVGGARWMATRKLVRTN